MTEFLTPYLPALAGGALIGLASTLLLALNGRVAGISGILFSALNRATPDRGWRLLFIAGLIAGAALFHLASGAPRPLPASDNPWLLAGAGLLVGLGTRIGSGCTSGHGVCGLGLLSLRGLAATCTFMLFAGLSTYASRHLLGWG